MKMLCFLFVFLPVFVFGQPGNWYAGDMHVHRNCGDGTGIMPVSELAGMMSVNRLSVICVLADMGNGEVKDSKTDLLKINGRDAPGSTSKALVHWDAEWHWDATYSEFGNQALGGHLVLLGLTKGRQIWDQSPYKILDWAARQHAVRGFAHMGWLNNQIQDTLNCCIPIDYPVEAALGTVDFVSEDVYGVHTANGGMFDSEAAIAAYYRLLNCGFRLGLTAGTDFPCNGGQPLGSLLTYVRVDGGLSYAKWIRGIKEGKTVVSRDGARGFIDLKVGGRYGPGDEMKLRAQGRVPVVAEWTSAVADTGRIELVCNGKVVGVLAGVAGPGAPLVLRTELSVGESSWICARRMNAVEHVLHTSGVYITVEGKPVRCSVEDAQFYVEWIGHILRNISPGGSWRRYFSHDIEEVEGRYRRARDIYKEIAAEAAKR